MASPDADSTPVPASAGAGRLLSLDAFRGLTIAGMILVNNPGSGHVYAPLRHAEWHGWTPTDLVFPSFLFIAGVSIPLALGKRIERGDRPGALLMKVFWRALAIFGIGLAMRYSPQMDLTKLRIPGVLQRIAVCYLAAALIFLKTAPRGRVLCVAGLLLGYWLVMAAVPVPGHGAGDLSRAGNLAAYVDLALMQGHLYKPDYDPEGLLSTFPAIATTLIGVLTGDWLKTRRTDAEKAVGLLAAGTIGVFVGWSWDALFPINKALWTSSYVVLAAGLSLQWLGVFYWLIEILDCKRWSAPLVIFGRNALAVFVLSGLGARFLPLLNVTATDGSSLPLKRFLLEHWFSAIAPPMTASLLFSITYVLFWLGFAALLDWRKIYIRV